ncbi:NAD(P)/FAD-dependent oxidoreductase [Ilumatobacter coccineus]|uniref:Putative oxidoreductase n=1 Tax=Ilumatobacter coccineus (strain NBRC 103263 / KCTC 29153 / YM16-304) TaxID=1313172 RepID=A0A6C7E6D5_ILUCY|nr:NAD(P)/FAD-dependent oxidoreductase [Ilumatobacter coccineus]BAN03284.1 putative oxidoreductase [Ilumatobacter coccineus YM16-304]
MSDDSVIVVGAGLAGLTCATSLHEAGIPVTVLEASDGVGGRVRSDRVDGFTLDRGFQVALTAYPEMHRQLDMEALDLQAFDPGALVWRNGKGSVVSDPFRMPRTTLSTALAPIGSPFDKLRIAKLRADLRNIHPARLVGGGSDGGGDGGRDDIATADALRAAGFSDTIIERFFTPLVGGIQLDPDLRDSRRMFDVIFRMLADGDSVVPAAGMQAIPDQLAARLPESSIRFDCEVTAATATAVTTSTGDVIAGSAVVVATEGPAASRLLGLPSVASKAAGCVYFAADERPTDSKMVVLDGTGAGPVLNVAVMSNVAPSYAPPGQHLIAAALPGVCDGDLADLARHQLRDWWGPEVDAWRHVATYRIPHGQPGQTPPFAPKQSIRLTDGRFVCGDHRDTGSIQGAMYSGRRCAAAVAARLG